MAVGLTVLSKEKEASIKQQEEFIAFVGVIY